MDAQKLAQDIQNHNLHEMQKTADKAYEALVGNTIKGRISEQDFVTYFLPYFSGNHKQHPNGDMTPPASDNRPMHPPSLPRAATDPDKRCNRWQKDCYRLRHIIVVTRQAAAPKPLSTPLKNSKATTLCA